MVTDWVSTPFTNELLVVGAIAPELVEKFTVPLKLVTVAFDALLARTVTTNDFPSSALEIGSNSKWSRKAAAELKLLPEFAVVAEKALQLTPPAVPSRSTTRTTTGAVSRGLTGS